MQLSVGWHGGETRMQDATEDFEIVWRVLRDDGDAFAGRKPQPLAQSAG
jgi:hypothetical protein